ncbi:MAG: S9 family peptidase [Wenzhouxiangellaceae bacterium]|nr:S9 family peptidase [Wenzhouxiangellaceae bacterium]
MYRIAISALLFTFLLLFSVPAPAQPEQLTLERIFDSPALSGPVLRDARLSPAGDRVSFLRGRVDDAETLDLWEYHIAEDRMRVLISADRLGDAEVELSAAEQARRERARIASLGGIVDYRWAEDGRHLLFALNGNLFLARLGAGSASVEAVEDSEAAATTAAADDIDVEPDLRAMSEDPEAEGGSPGDAIEVLTLTDAEAFDLDPKLSPDTRHVAFIRDQNLWLVATDGSAPRALTTDGEGTLSNGMAEFIAQEEMGRDTGYWWSPDGTRIAFLQVDASPIEPSLRYEVEGDAIRMIEQRYPYAGTPNVRYRLGVVAIESGAVAWIGLDENDGENEDIYIPRVNWRPDSGAVLVQRQSRDQKTLELIEYELGGKDPRVLIREAADTWINLHDDLHFLQSRNAFIWSSERSGFRHLYLVDLADGNMQALTAGDWPVTALAGVDEDLGLVYFTAGIDTPAEQHLYRQSLATATPEAVYRVSRRAGWHAIHFDRNGQRYLDLFSSTDQPPQLSLHAPDGERLAWLIENRLDAEHPYAPFQAAHRPTRFGTLAAEDGQTLHWRMIRPAGPAPETGWPVLVHVYGGPTSRMVVNRWSRRQLQDQYFAQQGMVVFSLDNRGIAGQGVAFQAPAWLSLGQVEVVDQLVGVEHLKTLDFIDPDRIGVFGWSYGGYMSLMMLMQHPGTFAAGVAVAPVTDWALYDTHYTERYLGMPRDEDGAPTSAYRLGNVLSYADRLADPLLLIHGMADDNVLFTHSTLLMHALQREAIDFELMTYPGEKHAVAGEGPRLHLWRQVARFLDRNLGD